MEPTCFNKRLVVDAIDQLIASCDDWQQHLFTGDDWLEKAQIRLRQCRSAFHGQILASLYSPGIVNASDDDIQLVAHINEITRLPIPISKTNESNEASDNWEDAVEIATPDVRGALDCLIDAIEQNEEIAGDLGLKDEDDWRYFWGGVREALVVLLKRKGFFRTLDEIPHLNICAREPIGVGFSVPRETEFTRCTSMPCFPPPIASR